MSEELDKRLEFLRDVNVEEREHSERGLLSHLLARSPTNWSHTLACRGRGAEDAGPISKLFATWPWPAHAKHTTTSLLIGGSSGTDRPVAEAGKGDSTRTARNAATLQ